MLDFVDWSEAGAKSLTSKVVDPQNEDGALVFGYAHGKARLCENCHHHVSQQLNANGSVWTFSFAVGKYVGIDIFGAIAWVTLGRTLQYHYKIEVRLLNALIWYKRLAMLVNNILVPFVGRKTTTGVLRDLTHYLWSQGPYRIRAFSNKLQRTNKYTVSKEL